MNTQKIQVIRQAEQMAKDLLVITEETVKTTIREAHNQASKIEDDTKKNAREEEKKVLAEYQHKGQEQATTILSELERELSKIDHSADNGEISAVAFLKDQMKVTYGN